MSCVKPKVDVTDQLFIMCCDKMLIKACFAFKNILLLMVVCGIIQGETLLIFPGGDILLWFNLVRALRVNSITEYEWGGLVSEVHNVLINKSSNVNDKYLVSNCP